MPATVMKAAHTAISDTWVAVRATTVTSIKALYLERYLNNGLTKEELTGGKPIIGIAQSGSDLVPCNRHHLELAKRVRDGIRDSGGIPMEFPVQPLFENCLRPTAALE